MNNLQPLVSTPASHAEPFETRIDALFRELELSIKWKRPSILLVIYSSEYIHLDAETALENRLLDIGQTVRRLKIRSPEDGDIASIVGAAGNSENIVFFVDGLRRGNDKDHSNAYLTLNTRRDFFIENCVRIIFWLTEKEATELAHHAPDYWAFRHRVVEFVESPRPERLTSRTPEPLCQGIGDFAPSMDDLDDKISLRIDLLNELPEGDESTAPRANLLLTLGVLHWRKGDFEKASEFLAETLRLVSKLKDNWLEALCYNAIALVETDLERTEEAIRAYQRAAALAPEQITPWNNIGKLYNRLDRPQEALEAFQKAIADHPEDAISWNGLGDLYTRLGRHEDAILAYQKALEITPNYIHSWNGLGEAYTQLGRFDQAIHAYQKAIEVDRRSAAAWIGLGAIFKTQGNRENALAVYKMANGLEPRNAKVWNELGDLYFAMQSYNEAAQAYCKVIESDHPCAQSYINLASIYVQQDRNSEAIPLYRRAIDTLDDDREKVALWNHLGDSYRRVNDYDNAIAAYRQADELDHPHAAPSQPIPPAEEQAASTDELASVPEAVAPENLSPDPAPQGNPISESILEANPVSESAAQEDSLSEPTQQVNPAIPEPAPQTDPVPESAAQADFLSEPAQQVNPAIPEPVPQTNPASDACPKIEVAEEVSVLIVTEHPNNTEENAGEEPMGEKSSTVEISFMEWLESLSNTQPHPEMEAVPESAPVPVQPEPEPEPPCPSPEPPAAPAMEAAEAGTGIAETTESAGNGEPVPSLESVEEEWSKRNASAWNELGNIYFNAGAEDEAANAFHKAIELDKDFGWPYSNLATIYTRKGRYSEAIPLFQKGIELVKDNQDRALLWNHMGDAYRRMNDHDNAMAAYRKAVELDPANTSLLTRARFSLLGNCRKPSEDSSPTQRNAASQ